MSRISYREQYTELEQSYREARNWLAQLEQMAKRSPEERRGKAMRIRVLRAARDTLYDLARQEEGAGTLTHPADYGTEPK
jgi:hypothetical protein